MKFGSISLWILQSSSSFTDFEDYISRMYLCRSRPKYFCKNGTCANLKRKTTYAISGFLSSISSLHYVKISMIKYKTWLRTVVLWVGQAVDNWNPEKHIIISHTVSWEHNFFVVSRFFFKEMKTNYMVKKNIFLFLTT